MNLMGSLVPAELTYIPPRLLMAVAYDSISALKGPISVENLPLIETVAPIRISLGDSANVLFVKIKKVPSDKMVMSDTNNTWFLQIFILPSSIKKGHPELGWPFGLSITRQYSFQILQYLNHFESIVKE
jgi:hypothetical protein